MSSLATGTVLGFDFGLRRIGVAVGDQLLRLAHPLTTLEAHTEEERLSGIDRLIAEWTPVQLVVGLPGHVDGRDEVHPLAALCTGFADTLAQRYQRPVAQVDERLSSAAASAALREAGVRGRRQKPVLDQVAAQQILQTYFDTLAP